MIAGLNKMQKCKVLNTEYELFEMVLFENVVLR